MITKYTIEWGSETVAKISVLGEDETHVWISKFRSDTEEERVPKRGRFEEYFDTWEEAYGDLLHKSVLRLRDAENQVHEMRRKHERIKQMRCDTDDRPEA